MSFVDFPHPSTIIIVMKHLKPWQIQKIEELLPLHSATAAVSLLAEKSKTDADLAAEIAHILDYHKQHRLTKEHESTIEHGNSSVTLLPSRGCVVTNLTLEGKQIFYHDRGKTQNINTSLRGSFRMTPYAGPAPKEADDITPLQHGYGRISEWQWGYDWRFHLNNQQLTDEELNEKTFYPDLHIAQSTVLDKHKAHFMLHAENKWSVSVPCAPGFHAYYYTPLEHKWKITLQGSGINHETLSHYLAEGIGKQWEKVLKFANPHRSLYLTIPSIGTIEIMLSSAFSHVWIWTEKGQPFVCVEPVARWNSDEAINMIDPGMQKHYELSLRLHKGL